MTRRFRVGQRVRLLKTYLGESGLTGKVQTSLPRLGGQNYDPFFAYIIEFPNGQTATYREDELTEIDVVTRLGDLTRGRE